MRREPVIDEWDDFRKLKAHNGGFFILSPMFNGRTTHLKDANEFAVHQASSTSKKSDISHLVKYSQFLQIGLGTARTGIKLASLRQLLLVNPSFDLEMAFSRCFYDPTRTAEISAVILAGRKQEENREMLRNVGENAQRDHRSYNPHYVTPNDINAMSSEDVSPTGNKIKDVKGERLS